MTYNLFNLFNKPNNLTCLWLSLPIYLKSNFGWVKYNLSRLEL